MKTYIRFLYNFSTINYKQQFSTSWLAIKRYTSAASLPPSQASFPRAFLHVSFYPLYKRPVTPRPFNIHTVTHSFLVPYSLAHLSKNEPCRVIPLLPWRNKKLHFRIVAPLISKAWWLLPPANYPHLSCCTFNVIPR